MSAVVPFSEISMEKKTSISFSRADRNLTKTVLDLSPSPAEYQVE